MLFTKKLGFEICQRRIAVMQFEAAVNPSMGACLKHPSTIASCIVLISDIRVTMFKNLSLHHRYPPQGLVAANTCTYKNVAASIIEFSCENGLLNVFEASLHGCNLLGQCRSNCRGTPKQAYMDVFTATFCRLFSQLNWPDTNIWGITTP